MLHSCMHFYTICVILGNSTQNFGNTSAKRRRRRRTVMSRRQLSSLRLENANRIK
jgi:hypothetical protein